MTVLDRMLRAREIVDRDGASIRQALIEAFLKTDPTDVDGYIRANHLMRCVLAEKGILDEGAGADIPRARRQRCFRRAY